MTTEFHCWVFIIDANVVLPVRRGHFLLKEVENNALKLGETRQTCKQPAITEGALRDVIRLDVVEELAMPGEISGPNPLAVSIIRVLHDILNVVGLSVRALEDAIRSGWELSIHKLAIARRSSDGS